MKAPPEPHDKWVRWGPASLLRRQGGGNAKALRWKHARYVCKIADVSVVGAE